MAATTAQGLRSLSLKTSVTAPPATRTRRITSTATNVQRIAFGTVCLSSVVSSSRQTLGNESRVISVRCNAAADQPSSTTSVAAPEDSWVAVIPTSALPRGERRLIRQDGDTVLLLWYKDQLYALENTSPAEGAYSEGFFNARLTPDGCIVCPSTDTTFDLKTGEIKDWYPTNPILAFLTRPTRILTVYPVKTDGEYVFINTRKGQTGESAEIVFGGQTQAGKTATDVSVDEVRMVVDENETGFGFTPYTELVNGRAAMLGCGMLILTELVSGKGFLKGIGFLDFLYQYIRPSQI
jgi:nitrite reductase/ring-hydroxylating ferredoxin subunit